MSRSTILVLVQFACIAFFVFTGPAWSSSPIMLVFEGIGIAIGIWAIAVMGFRQLTIFPEPKNEAVLLKKGPYRLIRHPMYTAVLLVCGSLAFDRFDDASLAVFGVLILNQILKLRHEEKLLLRHFGADYAEYVTESWALIPYVY